MFPTPGHTWVNQVYDTHETLQPVAFEITTTNFDEIEDEYQKFYSDKGIGAVQRTLWKTI